MRPLSLRDLTPSLTKGSPLWKFYDIYFHQSTLKVSKSAFNANIYSFWRNAKKTNFLVKILPFWPVFFQNFYNIIEHSENQFGRQKKIKLFEQFLKIPPPPRKKNPRSAPVHVVIKLSLYQFVWGWGNITQPRKITRKKLRKYLK